MSLLLPFRVFSRFHIGSHFQVTLSLQLVSLHHSWLDYREPTRCDIQSQLQRLEN
jgi:hypothetical protein